MNIQKMERDIKIICDRCDHLRVCPSGTTQTCQAKFEGSRHINRMTEEYIENRMYNGVQNCKEFKKL